MADQPATGPRTRYREQVRAEVQAHAWEQIAEAGASALSLKAIAQQMGITAPALYRYFAGRDELLTELILSAYRELAEVVESAAEGTDEPAGQLRATTSAIRSWAVSRPQRYLLLYGTPVPGYTAPDESTDLARRIFAPLLDGFTRLDGAGRGPDVLRRSLTLWTRLHGVLSLELAGHFAGMDVDPQRQYDEEVDSALA